MRAIVFLRLTEGSERVEGHLQGVSRRCLAAIINWRYSGASISHFDASGRLVYDFLGPELIVSRRRAATGFTAQINQSPQIVLFTQYDLDVIRNLSIEKRPGPHPGVEPDPRQVRMRQRYLRKIFVTNKHFSWRQRNQI